MFWCSEAIIKLPADNLTMYFIIFFAEPDIQPAVRLAEARSLVNPIHGQIHTQNNDVTTLRPGSVCRGNITRGKLVSARVCVCVIERRLQHLQ